jgi:outer membrane receptor protein involved in Fe transport
LGSVQQETVPGLSSTSDFVARGVEVEFVANPTDNWRLSLNVAKQQTLRSGSGAELVDYYGQIRQNLINAKLWDTDILDEAAVAGRFTFRQRLLANVLNPLAAITARDGTVSQEQRKWRFNLVSAYTFTESPLAGLQIGGALRWQDKAAVGYPLLLVESEGDTIQVPNLDNPFTTPASWNGDVFASYKLPLGKRTEWTVRIHLRNYLGDRKFRAEIINPDGSWAAVRIPVQKAFYLSNTIAF